MKLCFIICLILISGDATRILGVFPTPSISHQVAFRPLTLELAKRGHELVVLTTDPVFTKGLSPENYTEIDVHDMSYDMWEKELQKTSKGKQQDLYEQFRVIFDLAYKIFGKQVHTPEFQDILKSDQKFDLVILEAMIRPARILTHILNVPAILMSSMGGYGDLYDVVGAPSHPFLYPAVTRQRLFDLTFWEKLGEMYNHFTIKSMFKALEDNDDKFVENVFGPNLPKLNEVTNNMELLFLNAHRIWEVNRPVPPNVVYVGGIHQKPRQELPQDLKTFLDSSKHGVIYISFGTNVVPSLLPEDRIQILTKVFSQLPYDVLWKWDKDELPGKSENIKISKWFPQADLLRHPNIKLFITQGGLQSTEEAITAGVPLIGMPMLGDQWYNVELYEKHKIGLRLDMDELTEVKLKDFIGEVINDGSYRQNIARLRDQVYDQPQTSLERAVWWTEHVLRHGGGKHLQAAGANLSWSQYLDLSFILVTFTGLILTVTLFLMIICYLWTFISSFRAIIKFKKV